MPPKRRPRPKADLPLAQLSEFRTEDYLTNDDSELAAFVLMAALAFNDLKDLAQFEGYVIEKAPVDPDPKAKTPERGEYGGRRIYALRMLAGLINEVLQLIKEHKVLIASDGFQSCFKRMPDFARESWEALVDAALDSRRTKQVKDLQRALAAIRANLAFHYYQPRALLDGMKAFSEGPDGPSAYASLGRNGESSRFYFADAAAQASMNKTLGVRGIQLEDLVEYAGHIMDALRLLVEAYLVERRLLSSRAQRRKPTR